MSLWLGCPFTFRSRRAGDPARRGGSGGALGHWERCRQERGWDPSRAGAEREVGVGPAEDDGEAEDTRTSGAASGGWERPDPAASPASNFKQPGGATWSALVASYPSVGAQCSGYSVCPAAPCRAAVGPEFGWGEVMTRLWPHSCHPLQAFRGGDMKSAGAGKSCQPLGCALPGARDWAHGTGIGGVEACLCLDPTTILPSLANPTSLHLSQTSLLPLPSPPLWQRLPSPDPSGPASLSSLPPLSLIFKPVLFRFFSSFTATSLPPLPRPAAPVPLDIQKWPLAFSEPGLMTLKKGKRGTWAWELDLTARKTGRERLRSSLQKLAGTLPQI